MEWWVYAILVILFIGLVQPKHEPPPPSRPDAGRKGGEAGRKPPPRLSFGLKWKRNPGNLWARERRRNHPLERQSD